jgi:hypothetical protein
MSREDVERLLGRPTRARTDGLEYTLRTERGQFETTTTLLTVDLIADRVARYSVHPD